MADFSCIHPHPCSIKVIFIIGNLLYIGIGCFSFLQGLYTDEFAAGCSAIYFGVLKIFLGLFGCVVILVDKCKDFKTVYRCGMGIAVVWLLILLDYQVSRYEVRLSTKKIELNFMLMGYKDNKFYKKFWDETQISLQCCGIDSPTDWEYATKDLAMVPDSCCSQKEKCITPIQISSIYGDGCLKKMEHRIREDFFVFSGAAFVVLGYTLWMIYISYRVEKAKRRHEETELVNFATSFGVALPLMSDLREKEEDNLESRIEDENNGVYIYNTPVDIEMKMEGDSLETL